MVVWLIGLSGSGKTTLGRELSRLLKTDHPNTVFLDGDEVREVFGHTLGHTVEDRRRNAERITRLCDYLNRQGIHVVCAILSIFHESQRWNREHLKDYFEVYIDAPLEQLQARDTKGLYRAAARGELKHVVGVDIPFPPPCRPDVVVRNDGSFEEFVAQAKRIVRLLPGVQRAVTHHDHESVRV